MKGWRDARWIEERLEEVWIEVRARMNDRLRGGGMDQFQVDDGRGNKFWKSNFYSLNILIQPWKTNHIACFSQLYKECAHSDTKMTHDHVLGL